MSSPIAATRFFMRVPSVMEKTAMRRISTHRSMTTCRRRTTIPATTWATPNWPIGEIWNAGLPPLRSPLASKKLGLRSFASSSSESLDPKQIQVRLNEFQDLFVEARMCIDDVKDSIGTVYYDDDADDAREAVDAAIQHFEALVADITDIDEKNKVLRSNGLKVEQLKGELELTLNDGHDH